MELMHLMERLSPIMGLKNWDYCVLWKLSEDQRFLEWICCCCGGAEQYMHSCEQEILFPDSSTSPCRDVMFQHPRTTACDLLAQLPSSLALDSGIYAHALLSNQAKWLNFVPFSESNMSNETTGTRVLIPSPLGLLELFSVKQAITGSSRGNSLLQKCRLPEDEKVIDFVLTQCNTYLEQHKFQSNGDENTNAQNLYQQQVVSPVTSRDHSDHLSYDFPLKRKNLDTSSANFLPHFNTYNNSEIENNTTTMLFDQNTSDVTHFSTSMENKYMSEMDAYLQKQMMRNSSNQAGLIDDESVKQHDNGRSNSGSDSDQNEDEDDPKFRRRNGKGQSKNLVAERKRRKKLNERLYALRALVPKISKLDRASILGDAIEYVMELEKQVKDLQLELEEHSDDDQSRRNQNQVQPEVLGQNGTDQTNRPKSENGKLSNGNHRGLSANSNGSIDPSGQNQVVDENDKLQQMEPQVEVAQLDGNEFFVKVFREHKAGGFVRILEALNSLGLEVTNVNATRHTCLVSSIFKVEKRDNEMVQADHVRESLLELSRNPSRGWSEMGGPLSENNNANGSTDYLHNHQHQHQHQLENNHQKQTNSHHFHRHHHM